MLIRWANPENTYVVVEVLGNVFKFPASDANPEWLKIKSMIDAGLLIIPEYEPEV